MIRYRVEVSWLLAGAVHIEVPARSGVERGDVRLHPFYSCFYFLDTHHLPLSRPLLWIPSSFGNYILEYPK